MAFNSIVRNGKIPSRTTTTLPTDKTPLVQDAFGWISQKRETGNGGTRLVRIVLPRFLDVHPTNLEKYLNDEPLVGTRGAAIILGVSPDLMKKWRQRGKGPEYYQYGEGGPVAYSVRALKAFMAAHLVVPGKKGQR